MSFPRPDFPAEAVAAAKAHAVAEFPKESCGLIVDGSYVPCVNISDTPEKDFCIDPTVLIDVKNHLQAVIHSHPDGEGVPSKADQQSQIDMGVIWGLIPCNKNEAYEPVFWGDFRLEEPLIGREFIYGISDCGTLIRSYFWQVHNILLPAFASAYKWWKDGQDIYLANLAKAGFKLIDVAEAKEGDVFIGMVNSKVPNHGGILLSDGLGLHHLERRLSRREPVGRYREKITHWMRYVGSSA